MSSYTVEKLWGAIEDLTYSQMLVFAERLNAGLEGGGVAPPTCEQMADGIQWALDSIREAERFEEQQKAAKAAEAEA